MPVRVRILSILLACWTLFSIPVAEVLAASSTGVSRFKAADCIDFINERPPQVTCGFFRLPLQHEHGGDPAAENPQKNDAEGHRSDTSFAEQITIPVLIARSEQSQSEDSQTALLVPGAGGPGASIGFGYEYRAGDFLAPYQTLRQAGIDIIIVDQRGAGLSSPRLTCAENIVALESLLGQRRSIKQELQAFQSSMVSCRNRIRQNIQVEHFDTRQSALDFLMIMRELKYNEWFTIATSYATTIAQAMQALQPDSFDRLVLDSPVPLHFQQPMTLERTRRALVESINRCNHNAGCARRYPDLLAKLDSILLTAASKPYLIKIRIFDVSGNATIRTIVADDNTLLTILNSAIYYDEHISELPKVISGLHSGLTQSLNGFAETFWYQATDDTFADGLNMTVHCKERQHLEDHHVASIPGFENQLSIASRLILQAQKDLCIAWGVNAQPALLPNLTSDASTLILAGGLDPVISAEDIAHTASYFRNSIVETVAGATHSVWYQNECARDRVVEFLTGQNDAESSAIDCDAAVSSFK